MFKPKVCVLMFLFIVFPMNKILWSKRHQLVGELLIGRAAKLWNPRSWQLRHMSIDQDPWASQHQKQSDCRKIASNFSWYCHLHHGPMNALWASLQVCIQNKCTSIIGSWIENHLSPVWNSSAWWINNLSCRVAGQLPMVQKIYPHAKGISR